MHRRLRAGIDTDDLVASIMANVRYWHELPVPHLDKVKVAEYEAMREREKAAAAAGDEAAQRYERQRQFAADKLSAALAVRKAAASKPLQQGEQVHYVHYGTCRPAEVVKVHTDDVTPYYTVMVDGLGERSTERHRLLSAAQTDPVDTAAQCRPTAPVKAPKRARQQEGDILLQGDTSRPAWELYKEVMESVVAKMRELAEQEGLEPSVAFKLRNVRRSPCAARPSSRPLPSPQ